jgi:hypothetical protein
MPVDGAAEGEGRNPRVLQLLRVSEKLFVGLGLFLDPCREGCPLRKTREEVEANKKNRN